MNKLRMILMLGTGVLAFLAVSAVSSAQSAAPAAQAPAAAVAPSPGPGDAWPPAGGPNFAAPKKDGPRTIAPYFTPATAAPKAPDADGFLQRWLLLEPIVKPNRSNTVFTGTYVRSTFNTEYFPNQFTVLPHNGDKVTVAGKELAWHALDTANFDVKLYRFAYGLNKPTYGVIFWAVTVIDSPREMKNVRLAAGSNSASMWWLNGKEAAGLFDDRRMKMDDVVSPRLTLNKGKNILRGAVINGPGLSDFCVRLIDENGDPVKGITTSLE
jgi:hypothetical protein